MAECRRLASASPASIRLDRVTKRFPGGVVAVAGVELTVEPGEFFSLLGPSGCGKTTTLRMIAGFEEPDEGRVVIGGRDLTHVPVHHRDMGMVFQSYALFPHRTVAENVAFGLRMRKVAKPEADARVAAALAQVKLEGYEERRPAELSGGQQQRVALARAIVIRPPVLLCDEPLGALDRKLRQAMQVELKELQRALGVTLVFVTHDQEEALAMSDRIGVMNAGRLEQVGAPAEIYDRPRTRFVAEFIGEINLIEGAISGGPLRRRRRTRAAGTRGGRRAGGAGASAREAAHRRSRRRRDRRRRVGCELPRRPGALQRGARRRPPSPRQGGQSRHRRAAPERRRRRPALGAAGRRHPEGFVMATLGIAVIGQAPRDDIAAIFAAALPPDTRIVVRGCLDGLRDAEVDALPPRDGDDTLYTRLRGTRDVKISKAAVIERAPDDRSMPCGATARTRCSLPAPALSRRCAATPASCFRPASSRGSPRRSCRRAVSAFSCRRRSRSASCRRNGSGPGSRSPPRRSCRALSTDEAEAAAARLAAHRPDLIAMDCMSYTPETRAALRRVVDAPALLAVSTTARVLQELLA